MSFSVDQIASMLQEYESDKQTGMKVEQVAASERKGNIHKS